MHKLSLVNSLQLIERIEYPHFNPRKHVSQYLLQSHGGQNVRIDDGNLKMWHTYNYLCDKGKEKLRDFTTFATKFSI